MASSGHCFTLLALFLLSSAAYGQLSKDFYANTCPTLEDIVTSEVSRALDPSRGGKRRMGASLLRLFFHDCFVQGCDASVLLDDDDARGIASEKKAGPNDKSLLGFDVIDRIKSAVNTKCPGVVSCADILSLATRQAVVELSGRAQTWPLLLGRRDSTTANKTQANTDLPSPNSDLSTLITAFKNKGFSPSELVALSGAHTIGLAECQFVTDPIQLLKCSATADGVVAPLDETTPLDFDNAYYRNLIKKRGLLRSDQVLMDRDDLKALVEQYNSTPGRFAADFANAMKRLSELSVLTGANKGQIRVNCSRVN